MPFGLAAVPMYFQKLVTNILSDLEFVNVFLDDVLIASKDIETHYSHLSTVLERLSEDGLTININKSTFCKNKVDYLEMEIGEGYYKPSHKNSEALLKLGVPKTR